ncbi:MAG TPA: RnfH family protein [Rudaea sp.]|nr:RnfH family protein [Rudaea sp.]
MPERIRVSVVYADLNKQIECHVDVAQSASVDEAIRASAIEQQLPASFVSAAIAIFGRRVGPETRLHDGDRIELCRRLQIDPKLARRRRAQT